LAKVLQLTAQNALIYGLFISIVQKEASALATSAFVLASVLPSIFLSVPAGVLADFLPKKTMLLVSLGLRLVIVWLFLRSDADLESVLLLTFLAWTAYQFFTPSENAAIGAVVPPSRVPAALSLLHVLSLASQIMGAGVVAPLVIKFGSQELLFWIVFGLLWLSAATYWTISALTHAPSSRHRLRGLWRDIPGGLRAITHNEGLLRTTQLKAVVDSAMMMVIVAVPIYVVEILNTSAENTIYVALPGAAGLGVGLVLAPLLLRRTKAVTLTTVGFLGFVTVLTLLTLIDVLPTLLPAVGGVSARIVFVSATLPFAGLGLAFVQVASKTAVYRTVGDESIAQVLATQSAIGSLIALFPLVASGLLLDLLPVRLVLGMIAFTAAVVAIRPMAVRRSDY
ncbi:MAG: MFS transporter, partial [Thermomicrobiales bacterium]